MLAISATEDKGILTILIKDGDKKVKEIASDAQGWLDLFNSPQYAEHFRTHPVN